MRCASSLLRRIAVDLFFIASKAAWFFLTPSNFLIALVLAGLVAARQWPRHAALGARFAAAGALGLALFAFTPLANFLLSPLERRFPPIAAEQEIDGIILLGGALASRMTSHGYRDDLGEGADRVREAARLARLHPQARVLVSGGLAAPRPASHLIQPPEADRLALLLVEFGVDADRIEIENASRTTSENASRAFTAASPAPDETWALVTSASHMPRAMGAFRRAGFRVIAAPTDWRSETTPAPPFSSASANLAITDIAVKEFIGLLAYWASGRSTVLLPGPGDGDARLESDAPPTDIE